MADIRLEPTSSHAGSTVAFPQALCEGLPSRESAAAFGQTDGSARGPPVEEEGLPVLALSLADLRLGVRGVGDEAGDVIDRGHAAVDIAAEFGEVCAGLAAGRDEVLHG